MSQIRLADARVTETPAATMRTYAAPTMPGGADLAVWRTEMAAGASGPLHAVDSTQVVVVIEGRLAAEIDGRRCSVPAGDSVVLPAGAQRRLTAGDDGVVTLTASTPEASARVGDSDPVPVPWTR
jgi:quercetin dioxygenase-like cupin family protein